MTSLIASAAAFAALSGSSEPAQTAYAVQGEHCRVMRILPSGRRIVTPPSGRSSSGSTGVSASASSAGAGSSVSVSSSSHGSSVSSASVSTSDGSGARSVTTTQDQNGCTVVIDERGRRGARR